MRLTQRIFALLTVLLLSGVCLGADAEVVELIDQAEFTRRVCLLLQEAMPEVSVTQVGDGVIEVPEGEGPFQIGTDNMYATYCEDPSALQALLAYFVGAVVDIVQGAPEEALDIRNIMPVVRPKTYFDDFDDETVKEFVFDEWTPSLAVVYVWDLPTSVRNVKPSDLESLDIERDALRELACQNLERSTKDLHWIEENGRYWAQLDGMYETSLPLLSIWGKQAFPAIKGDLMVGIPERGVLLVFGFEDAEMMTSMIMYLRDTYQSNPYPALNGVLRWDGAAFEEVSFVAAGE